MLLLIRLCIGLLPATLSLARPEYATKEKLNCVQCHVTPWGGGPRTVFGKTYGTRGLGNSQTVGNDLFYGDFRMIGYYPLKETKDRANGVALMETAASANVPVVEIQKGSETRALVTYSIAPLSGASLREGYLRLRPEEDTPDPFHFLVGRFYVPFGLLTDEHRTYTRLQTNMTLNNFDVGLAASGNLGHDVHLDLALVNDFQTGGGLSTRDLTWAGVLNFRWNPSSAPFLLGVSANYERILRQVCPLAGSVYSVLSFDRLTQGGLSGSLQGEVVLAKNWNSPAVNNGLINPGLSQFFIAPDAADYATSVEQASSMGAYLLAKYNLSTQWTLLYKLDFLALDTARIGTHYTRHGIGFETYLNSNLILNTRVEFASSPEIATTGGAPFAAQNDILAMLRLWL